MAPLNTSSPLVQRKALQLGSPTPKPIRGTDPITQQPTDLALNPQPQQPATQKPGPMGGLQGNVPVTPTPSVATPTPSVSTPPASSTPSFSDPGLQQQITDLQNQINSIGSTSMGTLGDISKQGLLSQMNDQLKKLQSQYASEQTNNTALNTNYDTAEKAIQTSEGADVSEYNRLSPLAQRKLIGQLNARGLGSSLAAGGSGSGAYSELLNRQANGLGNIQSGYQGLQNNLEKQRAGDKIDLDAFYSNLANQRAYIRNLMSQNQAGFGDALGTIAGLGSLII